MAMKFEKASDNVVEAFRHALPADRSVQEKKMFGYPAAFINGNMFAGTWSTGIVVKLDDASRDALLQAPGAEPFRPGGRSMGSFVLIGGSALGDDAFVSRWLDAAFAYVASLPAKEPAPRRKKR